MRGSSPMPLTTWVMSAPASSQMLAITLTNEIFVARNALDAYLIISAEGTSVMIIGRSRSEEHTSELQSRLHLVCRLLLEKKKKPPTSYTLPTIRTTLPLPASPTTST